MSGAAKSTNTDAYLWSGASGDLWSTTGDWSDVTSGTNAVATVPGSLTTAIINGSSSSPAIVVAGDGSAANLVVTGNVGLSGNLALGAVLSVGSLSINSGSTSLALGTLAVTGSIVAGAVNVVDGTLSLGSGASVTGTGGITIGTPPGNNVAYNGSYINTGGAPAVLNLVTGSTLSTSGNLALANGGLADAGGQITIGGALLVGTAATSTQVLPNTSYVAGQVNITAGGTVTLAGAINDPGGIIMVGGAGSRLVAGGTVTLSNSYFTFYTTGNFATVTGSLAAVFGGFIQVGGVVVNPIPAGVHTVYPLAVSVDTASTIEVGTTGGAAAGSIAVDTGHSIVFNATGSLIGALVDNGTVTVNSGTLTQSGNVSGNGVLQIAAGASLLLSGNVGAAATISFAGKGSTLSIGNVAGTLASVAAGITGFQSGDTILISQTVTTATYTAGSGGAAGTLVLSNGTATLETLAIAGDYTGQSFFISPSNGGSSISVVVAQQGGTGTPSTNGDAFSWIGTSGGAWSGTGNWADTSAAINPATTVPGAPTPVTIAGASGSSSLLISGGGRAASLGSTGNLTLGGSYVFNGALTVGSLTAAPPNSTALVSGALALAASGSLSAASVTIIGGSLSLGSGATLSTTGMMALGTNAGTYFSYNGGYLPTFDAIAIANLGAGSGLSVGGAFVLNEGTLNDAGGIVAVTGSFSLGAAATPSNVTPQSYGGAGALQVSAGGTVSLGGAMTTPNGNITVRGTGSKLTVAGALTTLATGTTGNITAATGGTIRFAGLTLTNAALDHVPVQSLVVDTTSSIEVGTTGGAALGAITVDPGSTLTVSAVASFVGNLVDNGLVAITSGTLSQLGSVSGSGTISIGTGTSLVLGGNVDAATTIRFAGTSATLTIGSQAGSAATPDVVAGSVANFQQGDSIVLDVPVTSVSFTAVTGQLVLANASGTVETLTMSGSFSGQSFIATSTSNSATISLVNNVTLYGTAYDWRSHAQLANVQVTATGGAATVASGTTGSFAVQAAPAGTYALTVTRSTSDLGHAITAADALATLELAVGLNPNAVSPITGTTPLISPYQLMAADVNGDGKITAADALGVLQMAVGLASAPVARWKFVNETTNYWNAATNSFAVSRTNVPTTIATPQASAGGDNNVVGILMGDVNGSWAPLDGNGVALTSYGTQAVSGFSTLAQSVGAPIDQWAIASYTAAGAIAATATGPLSVVDAAARISSQLDGLEKLAKAGHLAGIWLTDSGATPVLSVTSAQASADADVIAAIHGNYTQSITSSSGQTPIAAASATMSAAITPALTIMGTPGFIDPQITNGAVFAALEPGQGVTEVTSFSYGTDLLALDLGTTPATDLRAFDVTLGGQSAIWLTSTDDSAHGVVLLGLAAGATGADMLAHHTNFAGQQALIG